MPAKRRYEQAIAEQRFQRDTLAGQLRALTVTDIGWLDAEGFDVAAALRRATAPPNPYKTSFGTC